jgi:hypothetical protein
MPQERECVLRVKDEGINEFGVVYELRVLLPNDNNHSDDKPATCDTNHERCMHRTSCMLNITLPDAALMILSFAHACQSFSCNLELALELEDRDLLVHHQCLLLRCVLWNNQLGFDSSRRVSLTGCLGRIDQCACCTSNSTRGILQSVGS